MCNIQQLDDAVTLVVSHFVVQVTSVVGAQDAKDCQSVDATVCVRGVAEPVFRVHRLTNTC